jgi:predicted DsbA family dithiol-disulfide isomerase
MFEITPGNDGLDLALLPEIAEYAGLDRGEFEKCIASGRHADKVTEDIEDAVVSGARGTPYSIIIAPNGKKFMVNGAQPYEEVKATLEVALAEK